MLLHSLGEEAVVRGGRGGDNLGVLHAGLRHAAADHAEDSARLRAMLLHSLGEEAVVRGGRGDSDNGGFAEAAGDGLARLRRRGGQQRLILLRRRTWPHLRPLKASWRQWLKSRAAKPWNPHRHLRRALPNGRDDRARVNLLHEMNNLVNCRLARLFGCRARLFGCHRN